MSTGTRAVCTVGLCAALLCVGAWIALPFSPPFTMQTLMLFGICLLFAGKKAVASAILYLLLAATGLPVLAGFQGGIGALLGPTGGFLLGFVPLTMCSCIPCRCDSTRVFTLMIGLLSCYTCGTLWYAALYTDLSPAGLLTALLTCVLPFVIPDTLKLTAAYFGTKRLKKSFSRLFAA